MTPFAFAHRVMAGMLAALAALSMPVAGAERWIPLPNQPDSYASLDVSSIQRMPSGPVSAWVRVEASNRAGMRSLQRMFGAFAAIWPISVHRRLPQPAVFGLASQAVPGRADRQRKATRQRRRLATRGWHRPGGRSRAPTLRRIAPRRVASHRGAIVGNIDACAAPPRPHRPNLLILA